MTYDMCMELFLEWAINKLRAKSTKLSHTPLPCKQGGRILSPIVVLHLWWVRNAQKIIDKEPPGWRTTDANVYKKLEIKNAKRKTQNYINKLKIFKNKNNNHKNN